MPHDYRFLPVTRADYPMLRSWLSEPHMAGWWGDAETEIALIEDEIEGGPCDMRIVWADKPFAFVQDYPVRAYGAPHYGHLPDEAHGMDTFLGDPAFLGQGHGAGYLRARAKALFAAGVPAVVVDPDPENSHAIATYAKAGFAPVELRPCEDGANVLVMDMWAPTTAAARTDDKKDLR
ncbi:MAG: GNAT family N-acetyltransferase [Pseudomonadota bacterium]